MSCFAEFNSAGVLNHQINWNLRDGGLPRWLSGKESACQCRRRRRSTFAPSDEKIPWSRKWPPTPTFLAWKSPWTEEPGGLQSMGSQRVGHDWTQDTHKGWWWFFLILMTPTNYSLDSVNCCPDSVLHSLLTHLCEYACRLSLKLTKFCCSGRHCFGKDPRCFPYLLQVIINPSFSQSLACLYLLAVKPSKTQTQFLGNKRTLHQSGGGGWRTSDIKGGESC